MWTLDLVVTFDPAVVACPALVRVVANDITSTTVKGCGTVKVRMPVFTSSHHLAPSTPGSTTPNQEFAVFVNGEGSEHMLVDPPAPIWVGAGDTFSSGLDQPRNTPPRVTLNNPDFTFGSMAVSQLDRRVPSSASVWAMRYVGLGRSGQSTSAIVSSQLDTATKALRAHRNSWNVFSVTGGLFDTSFARQLSNWYLTQCRPGHCQPWQPASRQQCPDWAAVARDARSRTVRNRISSNLGQLDIEVGFADPDARVIHVLYPHLVDLNRDNQASHGRNPCYRDAAAAIDAIDSIPVAVQFPGLHTLDLRPLFGSADVETGRPGSDAGRIQTTVPFGYPAPGKAGLSLTAKHAAALVSGD